jgi:uncharacterized membrane protein required for colicin V production
VLGSGSKYYIYMYNLKKHTYSPNDATNASFGLFFGFRGSRGCLVVVVSIIYIYSIKKNIPTAQTTRLTRRLGFFFGFRGSRGCYVVVVSIIYISNIKKHT